MNTTRLFLAAIVAGVLAPMPTAHGQQGAITGVVRDSAGLPVPAAIVGIANTRLMVLTDGSGAFRLARDSSDVLLVVRRLGFRPESLSVTATTPMPVAIALRLDPVVLRAVHVVDDASPNDTRIVPRGTVRNTPSFLEQDIIRTLTFMPSVSQPNDLKGRLHLAGGASDETGYALDGHPLQEPFHLAGVMGSLTTAALDRAEVTIHHLPVERDGRLGGLINFETARPTGQGDREITLGMASSSATVAHGWKQGKVTALASVRSTFIDELLTAAGVVGGRDDNFPLMRYRDAIGALRLGSTPSSNLSLTFFASSDAITDSDSARGRLPIFTWGETMVGLQGRRQLTPAVHLSARTSWGRVWQHDTTRAANQGMQLQHDLVSAATTLRAQLGPHTGLLGGLAFERRVVDDRWDFAIGNDWDVFASRRLPLIGKTTDRQQSVAVFSQVDTRLLEMHVQGGVRLNWFDGVAAPSVRLSARRDVGRQWSVRSSFSRRYQGDTQLEEPQEFNALQPTFFLDRPRAVNVLAASVIRSPAGSGTARWELSAFAKRYPNAPLLVGDPRIEQFRSGIVSDSFAVFERIAGRAHGVSLDMIWPVTSRWFVQGAYTWQRAQARRGGWSPSDWDTPHNANIFTSLRLGSKWSLSGALVAHSGLPLTPAIARSWEPQTLGPISLTQRFVPGPLNSGRVAGYFRSDFGIRREWRRGRRESSLSFNVLNASIRSNAITYDYSSWACYKSGVCSTPPTERRGIPTLPSLTFSTRW